MRRLSPILIFIFLAASVLIYVFGDSGVRAYNDLEKYRQRLAMNVESLRQHNRNLAAELADLKGDAELNVVLARRLGLYRPGDVVVKLEGLSPRVEHYVVGDLLKLKKGGEARSAVVKSVALCLSSLFAASAILSARASRRKNRGTQGG
jgi:cell division protein FtsB